MYYWNHLSSYVKQAIYAHPIPLENLENEKELLPEDIWKHIFRDFDIDTLCKISLVSKKWSHISAYDDIWEKFREEYKVQSPNIKFLIGRSFGLDSIYEQIIQNSLSLSRSQVLAADKSDYFCKLIKLFFDGNIRTVKIDDSKIFIALHKPRKIYFNNSDIKNIYIHEKCSFKLTLSGGLDFGFSRLEDENPIEINHSNYDHNSHLCKSFEKSSSISIEYYDKNRLYNSSLKVIKTYSSLLDKVRAIVDG